MYFDGQTFRAEGVVCKGLLELRTKERKVKSVFASRSFALRSHSREL